MQLSNNFSLAELTHSDVAVRKWREELDTENVRRIKAVVQDTVPGQAYARVLDQLAADPDAPFLLYRGRTWSRSQFRDEAAALAPGQSAAQAVVSFQYGTHEPNGAAAFGYMVGPEGTWKDVSSVEYVWNYYARCAVADRPDRPVGALPRSSHHGVGQAALDRQRFGTHVAARLAATAAADQIVVTSGALAAWLIPTAALALSGCAAIEGIFKEEKFHIRHGEHWVKKLSEDPATHDEAQAVCTQGLNMYRCLITYLAPIVPRLADNTHHANTIHRG